MVHLSGEVRRSLLSYDFWKSNGQANYDYRNRGAIVIRGGRKKGRPECFLLIIEKNHTAILQSLKQAADCALNPDTTGKHLVEAALKIARERHIASLELDDISKKDLSPSKSFKLGNVYFLTSGKTWYETLIPGLYPTQKADKIAEWRERVTTNRWSDVAARLPPGAVDAVFISGAADGIDPTVSGSAMVALHRMKDARTTFFADWEDELLIASGIGSLYGLQWRTDSF